MKMSVDLSFYTYQSTVIFRIPFKPDTNLFGDMESIFFLSSCTCFIFLLKKFYNSVSNEYSFSDFRIAHATQMH